MKKITVLILFTVFGIQQAWTQCTEPPLLDQTSTGFFIESLGSCVGSNSHPMYFVGRGNLSNPNEAGTVESVIKIYPINDASRTNLLKTVVIPNFPVDELHQIDLQDNYGGFTIDLTVRNNCDESSKLNANYFPRNVFDLDFKWDSCYMHNYAINGESYFCSDFSQTTYTLVGQNYQPELIDNAYYYWELNGTKIPGNSHSIEISDLQIGENELSVFTGSDCQCGQKGNYLNNQRIATKIINVDPDCNSKLLSGNLSFGLEGDCETPSQPAANVIVELNDGLFRTLTDSLGNYSFKIANGDYKISPSYYELCEYDTSVSVPTDSVKDFTVLYYNHVETHISMGRARPGTPFNATIALFNESIYDIENAQVEITFDGPMHNRNTDPNWNSITYNTFTIKNVNLKAQDFTTIDYSAVIDTNATIGDVIQIQSKVITSTKIYQSTNQTFVSNSYDPNDKKVSKNKIHIDDIDTRLQYQVRFQNTGNAPALKVVVTDTLDSQLDISTLKIGTASHDFTVDFTDNNVLVWTFKNINLPDSTTDLEGSQGSFNYSIKMKPSVGIGDEINNTANIYFDFNPPIITNTTHTRVMNLTKEAEQLLLEALVYPNPTAGKIKITCAQNISSLEILSLQGKTIKTKHGNALSEIDIRDLNPGSYLLCITAFNGQKLTKQVFKN